MEVRSNPVREQLESASFREMVTLKEFSLYEWVGKGQRGSSRVLRCWECGSTNDLVRVLLVCRRGRSRVCFP